MYRKSIKKESLAGTLDLDKLVGLYDDKGITIGGEIDSLFTGFY